MLKVLTVTLLSVSALALSACAANFADHNQPNCKETAAGSCHLNN